MSKIPKNIPLLLLHFSMWIFVFIFPLLFVDNSRPHPPVVNVFPEFILSIFLFYLNYFFLIKKLLFKKRYLLFGAINLAILLLFLGCDFALQAYADPFFIRKVPFDLFLIRSLLSFALSIGVAVAIRSTIRLREEQSLREKIENEHLKSEITYLKYQLQPHFFFNTLNNIYALIDRKPDLAKEVLHNLSKLLRYVLYHAEDSRVPLQSEIYFLKTYINLMQIRLSSNIVVKFEFPEEETEIKVPPLLFITLLENAYKHGIDATLQGNIFVKMELTESHVVFRVINSCSRQVGDDQTVSGIGLENLYKRLHILFNTTEFSLIRKQTDKEYYSELKIPAN
jgi:two-component system, LytTR family, sensor histidine kinase AlgZ